MPKKKLNHAIIYTWQSQFIRYKLEPKNGWHCTEILGSTIMQEAQMKWWLGLGGLFPFDLKSSSD